MTKISISYAATFLVDFNISFSSGIFNSLTLRIINLNGLYYVIINFNNQRYSNLISTFACLANNNLVLTVSPIEVPNTSSLFNLYLRSIKLRNYSMSDGELTSQLNVVDFSKYHRFLINLDFRMFFNPSIKVTSTTSYYNNIDDSTALTLSLQKAFVHWNLNNGKNYYFNHIKVNGNVYNNRAQPRKFLKFYGGNVLPIYFTTTTLDFPLTSLSEISLDFWMKFDNSCKIFNTNRNIYFIKNTAE